MILRTLTPVNTTMSTTLSPIALATASQITSSLPPEGPGRWARNVSSRVPGSTPLMAGANYTGISIGDTVIKWIAHPSNTQHDCSPGRDIETLQQILTQWPQFSDHFPATVVVGDVVVQERIIIAGDSLDVIEQLSLNRLIDIGVMMLYVATEVGIMDLHRFNWGFRRNCLIPVICDWTCMLPDYVEKRRLSYIKNITPRIVEDLMLDHCIDIPVLPDRRSDFINGIVRHLRGWAE